MTHRLNAGIFFGSSLMVNDATQPRTNHGPGLSFTGHLFLKQQWNQDGQGTCRQRMGDARKPTMQQFDQTVCWLQVTRSSSSWMLRPLQKVAVTTDPSGQTFNSSVSCAEWRKSKLCLRSPREVRTWLIDLICSFHWPKCQNDLVCLKICPQ